MPSGSRFPAPATATMLSRSVTAAVKSVLRDRGVAELGGEVLQSADEGVLLENDFPVPCGVDLQRVALTDTHGAADLLGDHDRPRSSMRRTIPVAFIYIHPPAVEFCYRRWWVCLPFFIGGMPIFLQWRQKYVAAAVGGFWKMQGRGIVCGLEGCAVSAEKTGKTSAKLRSFPSY